MKRREFGSLVVTAIAGLFVSGAALASGKKTQAATASGAGATAAPAAATSAAASTADTSIYSSNPAYNPNSFYITITTFFPYSMESDKYKALVKNCRNVAATDKLLVDMKTEGKLLSIQSLLELDKVTSCFEFCDEKAFKEYEERYGVIPGNSSTLKKQLGFKSKREFKRTVIS